MTWRLSHTVAVTILAAVPFCAAAQDQAAPAPPPAPEAARPEAVENAAVLQSSAAPDAAAPEATSSAEAPAQHVAAERPASPAAAASPAPAPVALNLNLPGFGDRTTTDLRSPYTPPKGFVLPKAKTSGPDSRDRTLLSERERSRDSDLRPITPGAPERAPVVRVKTKF